VIWYKNKQEIMLCQIYRLFFYSSIHGHYSNYLHKFTTRLLWYCYKNTHGSRFTYGRKIKQWPSCRWLYKREFVCLKDTHREVLVFLTLWRLLDRLCGLVVRVLGCRSGGLGSIPGTTKKKSSGSGTGSTQPREYNWGATW
jgi:hypothetical protein